MRHRHLTVEAGWSKAAIDSVLERGGLGSGAHYVLCEPFMVLLIFP